MNLLLDTIRLNAIGADQVTTKTDQCKNVIKAHKEVGRIIRSFFEVKY